MLVSNPKFKGKMHFEPASASTPIGEGNSGRWFKRVAAPLVLFLVVTISVRYLRDRYLCHSYPIDIYPIDIWQISTDNILCHE